LLRSLLAIILGDPNRLEALRVLVTAEPCCERWKMITAVSTLCLGYFTLSVPAINYGSHIVSFIDSLAQVFWRIPMIGLVRVASRRWLLPPASGLTPTSVVVVIAALRSRTDAYLSTVSLAAAFAHVFFSDG
jgi:DNA-binding transcriptional ArsR family regulator